LIIWSSNRRRKHRQTGRGCPDPLVLAGKYVECWNVPCNEQNCWQIRIGGTNMKEDESCIIWAIMIDFPRSGMTWSNRSVHRIGNAGFGDETLKIAIQRSQNLFSSRFSTPDRPLRTQRSRIREIQCDDRNAPKFWAIDHAAGIRLGGSSIVPDQSQIQLFRWTGKLFCLLEHLKMTAAFINSCACSGSNGVTCTWWWTSDREIAGENSLSLSNNRPLVI
jgi:hypothetical protein